MKDFEIVVTKQDLAGWLLCFFRYSLGRHTYITGVCVDDLIKYWDVMPTGYRGQIIRDLEHYFKHGLEGEHSCDIDSWRELLEFAKVNQVNSDPVSRILTKE